MAKLQIKNFVPIKPKCRQFFSLKEKCKTLKIFKVHLFYSKWENVSFLLPVCVKRRKGYERWSFCLLTKITIRLGNQSVSLVWKLMPKCTFMWWLRHCSGREDVGEPWSQARLHGSPLKTRWISLIIVYYLNKWLFCNFFCFINLVSALQQLLTGSQIPPKTSTTTPFKKNPKKTTENHLRT